MQNRQTAAAPCGGLKPTAVGSLTFTQYGYIAINFRGQNEPESTTGNKIAILGGEFME